MKFIASLCERGCKCKYVLAVENTVGEVPYNLQLMTRSSEIYIDGGNSGLCFASDAGGMDPIWITHRAKMYPIIEEHGDGR